MNLNETIGLNVKWYRYQNRITQKQYSNITKFKIEYISAIEKGKVNLTCKNLDILAKSFHIIPELLFNEKTAQLATKLPTRLDSYRSTKEEIG